MLRVAKTNNSIPPLGIINNGKFSLVDFCKVRRLRAGTSIPTADRGGKYCIYSGKF
jgi:hypothetical protein